MPDGGYTGAEIGFFIAERISDEGVGPLAVGLWRAR